MFIGRVKFASQFPIGQLNFPLLRVKSSTNVLFAPINIVYGLALRSAVHGGFAAWKQVSPSSVASCCELVGVESEKFSFGEETDSDRIEAVIGGLMQSLFGKQIELLLEKT